jgi:hypothetical protein
LTLWGDTVCKCVQVGLVWCCHQAAARNSPLTTCWHCFLVGVYLKSNTDTVAAHGLPPPEHDPGTRFVEKQLAAVPADPGAWGWGWTDWPCMHEQCMNTICARFVAPHHAYASLEATLTAPNAHTQDWLPLSSHIYLSHPPTHLSTTHRRPRPDLLGEAAQPCDVAAPARPQHQLLEGPLLPQTPRSSRCARLENHHTGLRRRMWCGWAQSVPFDMYSCTSLVDLLMLGWVAAAAFCFARPLPAGGEGDEWEVLLASGIRGVGGAVLRFRSKHFTHGGCLVSSAVLQCAASPSSACSLLAPDVGTAAVTMQS